MLHRIVLALGSLACALALPAASFAPPAVWPQFRHDAGHSGWNRAEDGLTVANVRRLHRTWVVPVGGEVRSSPAVVAGVVYVGSDDGTLHALATATGRELWRAELGAWAADGGRVDRSVQTDARAKPARPDDGADKQRLGGSGNWSSSPTVVGGRAYVLAGDSVVHAFDAATGQPAWATSISGLEGGWLGSPTVAWGRVFVIRQGVAALDAADGHVLWTRPDLDCFGCSASASNGRVFVAGWNADDPAATRGIYALDAATGGTLWRALPEPGLDVASGSSPVVARDLVFVRAFTERGGSKRLRIYALDPVTGEQRWAAEVGTSRYDAATGKPLWRSAALGRDVSSSPTVAGATVYVGSAAGRLYAFRPR